MATAPIVEAVARMSQGRRLKLSPVPAALACPGSIASVDSAVEPGESVVGASDSPVKTVGTVGSVVGSIGLVGSVGLGFGVCPSPFGGSVST